MKNRALVVIDMQNDFISGRLAVKDGEELAKEIASLISGFSGDVFLTQDVHSYMDSLSYERVRFPEHCMDETEGCDICPEIRKAYSRMENYPDCVHVIRKCNSFRSVRLETALADYTDITFVGVCTDICVITNALNIRAAYPAANIHVLAYLCRGTTIERHEAAIEVMKSCLIDVVEHREW